MTKAIANFHSKVQRRGPGLAGKAGGAQRRCDPRARRPARRPAPPGLWPRGRPAAPTRRERPARALRSRLPSRVPAPRALLPPCSRPRRLPPWPAERPAARSRSLSRLPSACPRLPSLPPRLQKRPWCCRASFQVQLHSPDGTRTAAQQGRHRVPLTAFSALLRTCQVTHCPIYERFETDLGLLANASPFCPRATVET